MITVRGGFHALAEMKRHEFKEWKLHFESPPSTLGVLTKMCRSSSDPMQWLDNWLRSIGMQRGERTAIELHILCRALQLGICFDQLNAPTLACFEVLVQRISQLVDAYSAGDASKPDWRKVKFFVEDETSLDIVLKALRQHAHKLLKEEADAEGLRAKTYPPRTGEQPPKDGGGGGGLSRRAKAKLRGGAACGGSLAPPAHDK